MIFFNSINAGCGKDLNWFWKRWFFDTGVPDLAIAKFSRKGSHQQIIIESIGSKPLPVDVTIFYKDGSTDKIHRSIAVWEKGNKTVALNFISTKNVKSLSLGSTYVPDVNKANNVYKTKNEDASIHCTEVRKSVLS